MRRGITDFLCAALPLLLLAASGAAHAAEPRRVLILNSYHQGYKWTDDETRGVISAIGHTKNVRVYVEYMGTKWSSDQAYFRQLRDIYQSKFRKIPFDVIVATDNDAFDFLRRYRDEVFGKLPTVFCGVNVFQMENLAGYDLFTGLNETAEFKENIDLILRLHARTKTIVFITDTSITGRKTHDLFVQAVPEYRGRINFQLLEDVTMNDLLETVARLPDGSVVLHTFFFKDKAGRIFEYDESIELISAASRVPVYGAWDFSLGHGIIGGYLTNGFEQGRGAGEMAAHVLSGARIEDIPPVMKSPARLMFDQRQMDRWGIRRTDLPENSVVINAPPPFYAVNKGLVWGVGFGMACLTLVVALLARLYRQAQRAVRMRDEFLMVASHELRTPVTSLRLSLQTLQRAERMGEKVDAELMSRLVGLAACQGERLNRLVGELLDVSRIAIGPLPLDLRDVQLGAIVRDVVERFEGDLSRAGCPVAIQGDGAISGRWDRSRIDQVLTNLLSNAVKFGAGKPIEILFGEQAGTAWLTVRDHGIGIEQAHQARIFERLARVVSILSYGGLGLGLYVSRRVVEAHGGRLRVDSQPGSGSSFTVELPRAEPGSGERKE
jgi:signal transduction histidine kinase